MVIDGTNAEIRFNRSVSEGGAIYISDGSTLSLIDGKIHNNYVEAGNGGAFAAEGGSIDMSGGEIFDNKAETGGGVYIYSNGGTFTMSGNAVISGNTAGPGNGGGVALSVGSIFIMQDGAKIKQNTAKRGGGVFIYDYSGIFLFMKGGTIYGTDGADANIATDGAVFGASLYKDGPNSSAKYGDNTDIPLTNGSGYTYTSTTINGHP